DPNFDIYQLQANNEVNEDSVGARLDFKLNARHSLYTRFFRDLGRNFQPQSISGRVLEVRTWPQNGVMALQSTMSASMVNELRLGYNGALTRGFGRGMLVNGSDLSAISMNIPGTTSNND